MIPDGNVRKVPLINVISSNHRAEQKTKTEPEDDFESSLNFTLNTQISEETTIPSQPPLRCSTAFSQASNPFEFTQERPGSSNNISTSQTAFLNKWADVESATSGIDANQEELLIAKVEQCSSPGASCQDEA